MEEFLLRLRGTWWFTVLVGIISFLVGAIPAWLPIIKDWLRPTFVATVSVALVGRGALKMVSRGPGGWIRRDIDLALYLKVTNNSTSPTELSGYLLEIKTDRDWKRIARVELFDPFSVEWSPPNAPQPSYLDLSENGFDVLARSKTIEPGHSIEGWAFFTGLDSPVVAQLRLALFDTKGGSAKIRMPMPRPAELAASITRASFKVLPRDWKPPWAEPVR